MKGKKPLLQIDVIGRELKRRPLTQHDAEKLGVTDLASRIRDLRAAGRKIETIRDRRPSRYKPRHSGQVVGVYIDLERRYARRAMRDAARRMDAGRVAA